LSIAAGDEHTCASVNGGMECWGNNGNGELGVASTTDSLVPVPVQGLSSGILSIAAGGFHVCALVDDGIQCWGSNSNGQLGNDSTSDVDVPVQVSALLL
jgi:alpha-tubulin suppressor-like RCC1 family protein